MITRWVSRRFLAVLRGVSSTFYPQAFKKVSGNALFILAYGLIDQQINQAYFTWNYINSLIRRAGRKPWSADEKIGRDISTLK